MSRYGNYYYQGSGLWRSLRDGDFEESEVWDVIRERKDQSPETSVTSPPSDQQDHRYTSAPRMLQQSSVGGGGSSSGSSSGPQSIFANQSAPVNIPKWSNVARHLGRSKSSKACKTQPWRNGVEDDGDDDGDDNDDDEDKDDDDGGRCGQNLPPHEYIATRLARSKISSFSVFEGVGRKLKGRDLSRVRNDVLTKTGFLESP